jgi:putative chitinase
MPITADQLKKLHIGEQWVEPLNETFARFDISNPLRQAAFIGQAGHESGNFTRLSEGLSYSAERLMVIWPKRFPNMEIAQKYARNPKALANNVYANRMGNRDEASGDGFRFAGAGLFQLTGHSNFYHAGQALGEDFVMQPELVKTPRFAALTAGWFWDTHKLNQYADSRDYRMMTKKINGAYIGLADREKHINHALAVLAG